MKKAQQQIEKLIETISAEIDKRGETFSNRPDKWQVYEKGIIFRNRELG